MQLLQIFIGVYPIFFFSEKVKFSFALVFNSYLLLFGFQGFPHLDVKIKWPNDIYLNGLKIAGISCNSKYKSGIFNVSSGKWFYI